MFPGKFYAEKTFDIIGGVATLNRLEEFVYACAKHILIIPSRRIYEGVVPIMSTRKLE